MFKKTLVSLVLFTIGVFMALFRADLSLEDLSIKYAGRTSRFVKIDGQPIHYKSEGKGFPIILLHGTASSLQTWDKWSQELSQYYQVVRIDLPGFGLTGPFPDNDYSMKHYSEFLEKFISTVGLGRCYIAGNSLGGEIAWNFTIDYPERVEKLILIDAAGYPNDAPPPFIFRLAKAPGFNTFLRFSTPRFMVRNNLEEVYYDDSKIDEDLVERYQSLCRREGNRRAFIYRMNTAHIDRSDELSKIKQKTLIQWGKHDKWIPYNVADSFATSISHSVVKIYENAGHVPMEEIPEETVADAIQFLQEDSPFHFPFIFANSQEVRRGNNR
ncbi:alpha/beta hydrolase [Imperialibacter roseus]|jgi:pimeloyl-ACP methyl ester carboxylesterase|uniref:Alpha/beta hydrolase n=2 Tax=Imperialibacter TaxID=1649461 RepID=A0ABZ0IQB6_9BACT|nr:alpha/beta hydrolase [Imperialibacter roseus]WOK06374.1 alpha/beta hydrolase [Imperialibacter roseus]|tara:strand:- start:17567 stop:18547 length:981 start_codon:yes stop_codon:yes gene_type:complete